MKFKPDENLYIFSMGKRFRVTAIFTSDAEANAHMERDKDASCIASFGGPDDPRGTFVFIANKYDSKWGGRTVSLEWEALRPLPSFARDPREPFLGGTLEALEALDGTREEEIMAILGEYFDLNPPEVPREAPEPGACLLCGRDTYRHGGERAAQAVLCEECWEREEEQGR